MPELILMRGIPGSGKSTWAKVHSEKHGHVVLSTDDYWYRDGSGVYKFDPRLLQEAHRWNQGRVRNAMIAGSNIIVDNTNLDSFAVRAYFDLAMKYGYSIHVEVMDASLKTCMERNMNRTPDRRIPESVISCMYAKFLTPLDIGREEERAYARKLEADIAKLKAFIADVKDVMTETSEYLEDHYDIRDGDDGEPRPNKAMSLGGRVNEMLNEMEKLA